MIRDQPEAENSALQKLKQPLRRALARRKNKCCADKRGCIPCSLGASPFLRALVSRVKEGECNSLEESGRTLRMLFRVPPAFIHSFIRSPAFLPKLLGRSEGLVRGHERELPRTPWGAGARSPRTRRPRVRAPLTCRGRSRRRAGSPWRGRWLGPRGARSAAGGAPPGAAPACWGTGR